MKRGPGLFSYLIKVRLKWGRRRVLGSVNNGKEEKEVDETRRYRIGNERIRPRKKRKIKVIHKRRRRRVSQRAFRS